LSGLRDPEMILRRIETEAKEEHLPIIGPIRGLLLDEVVRKYKPRNALEVGTLVGYSAIRIARLMPSYGRLTCIDVDGHIVERAKRNIRLAGLEERVEVLTGDARKILPSLHLNLDMLFLDAEKTQYMEYLKASENMLHKGSVVVADNVKTYASRMVDYLNYVRKSENYRSNTKQAPDGITPDPSGDAVEISEKIK